jgi:Na+/melibiose symporter-like transporter
MARKKSRKSSSRNSSSNSGSYSRRKSDDEARIERFTWFLLVMIFGVIYLFPESTELPNWLVPVAGSMILLGSGIYQYTRRWHVSPITWIAGSIMFVLGLYGLYVDPNQNMLSFSMFTFAAVIGIGVLTGET